jgi:hypothetical protein
MYSSAPQLTLYPGVFCKRPDRDFQNILNTRRFPDSIPIVAIIQAITYSPAFSFQVANQLLVIKLFHVYEVFIVEQHKYIKKKGDASTSPPFNLELRFPRINNLTKKILAITKL